MTIPHIIHVESKGNYLSGIINEIKTKYNFSNPIKNGMIIPTSSKEELGDVGTVVLWNENVFRTRLEGDNIYVQLMFPNRYLFINAYSLRGIYDEEHYNRDYAKKWRVEGFNVGEEDDRRKWTLLAENTSSEGDYCGTGMYCQSLNIATFTTKRINRGFRYIRWTATASSNPGSYLNFATSGIDVYGKLILETTYFSMMKKLCSCKLKTNRLSGIFYIILIR